MKQVKNQTLLSTRGWEGLWAVGRKTAKEGQTGISPSFEKTVVSGYSSALIDGFSIV